MFGVILEIAGALILTMASIGVIFVLGMRAKSSAVRIIHRGGRVPHLAAVRSEVELAAQRAGQRFCHARP